MVTCCKCKCNSNRADCGINLLANSGNRVAVASGSTKCSSCNDQTIATSHCTSCDDMLCDACVSAHKRVKLTRDHPIVPLNRSTSNGPVPVVTPKVNKRYSCAKHSYGAYDKMQYYKYYCDVCNKVTCAKCHEAGGEHFNHQYSDVNIASSSFRNNLMQQLGNLNEKVIA